MITDHWSVQTLVKPWLIFLCGHSHTVVRMRCNNNLPAKLRAPPWKLRVGCYDIPPGDINGRAICMVWSIEAALVGAQVLRLQPGRNFAFRVERDCLYGPKISKPAATAATFSNTVRATQVCSLFKMSRFLEFFCHNFGVPGKVFGYFCPT